MNRDPHDGGSPKSGSSDGLLQLFRPRSELGKFVDVALRHKGAKARLVGVSLVVFAAFVAYLLVLLLVSNLLTPSLTDAIVEPIRTSQPVQGFVDAVTEKGALNGNARRVRGMRGMIASLRQPFPDAIITLTIAAILAFPLSFLFTIPCRRGRHYLAMDLPVIQSNRQVDAKQPWTRLILEAKHLSAANREVE